MLTYKLIFIFNLLLSILHFDKKTVIKQFFPFVAFYLIFLVGFRYDSVDYDSYLWLYSITTFNDISFPFYDIETGTTGSEFIFATLSSFFNAIGFPFYVFSLFIAFVSLSLKFYVFNKVSPYLYLSLLIYISVFVGKDLGQVRNGLAAAIVCYSIFSIYDKKFYHFLFYILLASLIQVFAVIALPLYFLYHFNIRTKNIFLYLLIFSSVVISLLGGAYLVIEPLIQLIGGDVYAKVYGYATSESRNNLNPFGLGNLFFLAIGLYSIFKSNDIKASSPYAHVLILFLVFGTALYTAFADFSILAFRSFELFSAMAITILLPIYVKLFKGYKKLFVILIIYFFCFYTFTINLDQIYEYKMSF